MYKLITVLTIVKYEYERCVLHSNHYELISSKKDTSIDVTLFIMSNFGRVAILFNCCSTSTKQQLLSMEVGKEALDPEYTFVDLLRTVFVLCKPKQCCP